MLLGLLIALDYAAPSECPAQAELWARAVEAAPELRSSDRAKAERAYQVSVTTTPSGFHAELREDESPLPRSLDAADCGELVQALALMLALSATESEASAKPDTAPAPAHAPTPAPALAATASRRDVAAAPARPREVEDTARVTFGPFGWLGATPDLLRGLDLAVEVAFEAHFAGRLAARTAFGAASPSVWFAGIVPQLCAQQAWTTLGVSACAGAAAGMLELKGVEGLSGNGNPWLAPLLAARATLPITSSFELEASIEAEYALVRQAYHVKAANEDYQPPPISALLTLAAGVRF